MLDSQTTPCKKVVRGTILLLSTMLASDPMAMTASALRFQRERFVGSSTGEKSQEASDVWASAVEADSDKWYSCTEGNEDDEYSPPPP
jgi:hypothetical protein